LTPLLTALMGANVTNGVGPGAGAWGRDRQEPVLPFVGRPGLIEPGSMFGTIACTAAPREAAVQVGKGVLLSFASVTVGTSAAESSSIANDVF
jgi:hypothetical protein